MRSYCIADLGKYINGPEYDTTRRMLSKLAYGEPLGRMEHEKQRAYHLYQCHDLTPREKAAAHLLGTISSYRIIAWFRELTPPNGQQTLPPLSASEIIQLNQETTSSIKSYTCFLPEREASVLISEWESKSSPMPPYTSIPKSADQLKREREAPLPPWNPLTIIENVQQEKEEIISKINKLRRNNLDAAIDKAIEKAGNTETADVYVQLKALALSECLPFNGVINGDALCYTDDNDELDKLSKNALAKRLKRRKMTIKPVK